MHVDQSRILRRILTVSATLLLPLTCTHAFATSPTSSGTLNVSATVASSIQLTFSTATSGPTLTGAGTNNATLAFGKIVAYGTEPATGVTLQSSSTSLANCGTCFVVSAPVNIVVTQADGSSANFSLTAQLSQADSQDYWAVGTQSNQVTNTSAATIFSTGTPGSYGTSGNTVQIYLGVPNGTVTTTNISNAIDFIATAN